MTLMNTVMFGPIKKEVNGSHYNLHRDGDGNHIPNTSSFREKKVGGRAVPECSSEEQRLYTQKTKETA